MFKKIICTAILLSVVLLLASCGDVNYAPGSAYMSANAGSATQ